MNKNIIFIILGVLAIIGLVLIFSNNPTKAKESKLPQLKTECQAKGGNWLDEYAECEYGDKEWCEQNGGVFNECGSACRHDKDSLICTMQCVFFCKF